MSDSGRQIGDCPHAKARDWCVECARADERRRCLDALRGVWNWYAKHDSPLPETWAQLKAALMAELAEGD
jgi:hypothetical protein